MNIPHPSTHKVALLTVWASFAAICALYLAGGAAYSRIPFGPPIDLLSVLHQLTWRDFFAGKSFSYYLVLAAAFIVVACYTFSYSRRVRVSILLGGLFLPLIFLGRNFKGLAAWFLAIPQAPVLILEAVTGKSDGEFYNEGFLVYTAIGWWMLYCLALLCCEMLLFAIKRMQAPE